MTDTDKRAVIAAVLSEPGPIPYDRLSLNVGLNGPTLTKLLRDMEADQLIRVGDHGEVTATPWVRQRFGDPTVGDR